MIGRSYGSRFATNGGDNDDDDWTGETN